MNTTDKAAWAAAVASGDTMLSFAEWVGDKRADEYGLADFLAKLPLDDHPKRVIRALVRDLLAPT